MKLLDRIALTRSIRFILDFILDVLKMFVKENNGEKPEDSPKPKNRRKMPWRR